MNRRFLILALVFVLIFGVVPAQAATTAEITAQMDSVQAQITALENELERDYPNVVSVNGEIIRSNPLTVKVMQLFGYDYYVVQNPVAGSEYMFGMYYNNYHKVTGSTVIYVDGVAINATVVGTGYPRAKEIKRQLNDLKTQLSELDDQLYLAQLDDKLRPIQERNGHLKSLQSVRQDGVRLICKLGNPYLLVCGEEAKPVYSPNSGGVYYMRRLQVYPMELSGGIKDYGVRIEEYNPNATPVVVGGVTMIPPRPLVEWLGGSLDWDASTGVITCNLSGNTVVVVIGSNIAYVNGVAETMPGAVTIYNNKTVVPLRFVAEKLGCRVEWIPEGQYIQIYGGTNQRAGYAVEELPPEYSWAAPLLGIWSDCDIIWNAAGQYVEFKWAAGNGCGKLAYNEAGSLCATTEPMEKTSGGSDGSSYWQINSFTENQIEANLINSHNVFPFTFKRSDT